MKLLCRNIRFLKRRKHGKKERRGRGKIRIAVVHWGIVERQTRFKKATRKSCNGKANGPLTPRGGNGGWRHGGARRDPLYMKKELREEEFGGQKFGGNGGIGGASKTDENGEEKGRSLHRRFGQPLKNENGGKKKRDQKGPWAPGGKPACALCPEKNAQGKSDTDGERVEEGSPEEDM